MRPELVRQAGAEAVGTAFLVAAVVGSGIAAVELAPSQPGIQLLINSVVTGAVLTALILALQPVSAAFNPLVTLLERVLGALGTRQALILIGAQLIGGCAGAVLANLMFARPAVAIAAQVRSGGGLWLGEVVATTGLLLVVFGTARGGRPQRVALAVGGYLTAAYWFTSSTSFANPAVTVARMLSDTFAGIAPRSVPAFVLMQLLGALVAYGLIRLLLPERPDRLARAVVRARPVVLLVCVHNAGRSQMAAGYLRRFAGEAIDVRSAGSRPTDRVNPVAVEAMAEDGIDIGAAVPRRLTDDAVQVADVVITMGCGDSCPVFPGKRYEDWAVADPAGLPLSAVRPIRDDIRDRARRLAAELTALR